MSRRRTTDRHILADDQALDQISKEAEEKLQKKRLERAAARETRLRELERQQKEEEARENERQGQSDKGSYSSYTGSRRGSDASSESDISSSYSQDPKDHIRELKHQLRDFEEKYKQAMMTNAQLDNTITTQMFQLELLKEQMEEKDESILECQREYKSKSRELELLKRDYKNLQGDCDGLKEQMAIKDQLLHDSGLVIVSSEEGVISLSKCSDLSDISVSPSGASLISQEAAEILNKAGEGTLDDKIKKIAEERASLQEEIKRLTECLEEERTKEKPSPNKTPQMNGPEMQLYEVQREASKQIHEYKLKLQKAEQEITNLDGTVMRLETQVKRYKYDAEEAEKLEDELKTDRRRLQREVRECQTQIEELSNQNKHLNKRLEKIRQTRSALGVQ